MQFFTVAHILFQFYLVFAEDCSCGNKNVISRIIGGREVPEGKYPWMAALVLKHKDGGQHQCGGAIINNLYIVTAAHCMNNVANVAVSVGSNRDGYTTPHEILPSTSFIQHPKYETERSLYDIALVRLTTPLTWSTNVQPICLPPVNMDESGKLHVAGWGIKNVLTGASSHILLQTIVEEYDFEKCSDFWGGLDSRTQFCAGLKGHDSCGGDSGGPLWKSLDERDYLIGIVSYGVEQCGSQRSAVYTKVTGFLDWIKQNTKDANYCDD